MNITAAMVKELREMSGAGMMDCKKALTETNGDMDKAMDFLREKGLGAAKKKAGRVAAEGIVMSVGSDDSKKASIVEVNSETDFVAKNDKFKTFVSNVANQILASGVKDLDTFLNSEWSLDNSKTVQEELSSQISVIGENMTIRRFSTLEASENGFVCRYDHFNGKVSVLVHVECDSKETVEKSQELIKNIAMHISAMSPTYLSYKDFDKEWVEKEFLGIKADIEKENEERVRLGKTLKHIPEYGSMLQLSDEVIKAKEEELKAELLAQGKPEKILGNIIPGMIKRFIKDNTLIDQQYALLSQDFVLDAEKTVEEVLAEKSKEISGTIEIKEYVRLEVGEGIEKKEENFAEEVAKQMRM